MLLRDRLRDIRQYKNKTELYTKDEPLYEYIRKHNLLDFYFPLNFRGMTRDEIIKAALEYQTKEKLKEKDRELYLFMSKQNMLYYTFKEQYAQIANFADHVLIGMAKPYPNRTQCNKKNRFLVSELKRRDLLEKAFPPRPQYGVQYCFRIAGQFETRKDLWQPENHRGVYDWLSKTRWDQINEVDQKYILDKMNLNLEPPLKTKLLHIAIPEIFGKVFTQKQEAMKFATKFKSRKKLKSAPNGGRACWQYLKENSLLDEAYPSLVTLKQIQNLLSELNTEGITHG